jgi:hypothetical protein
MNSTQRLPKLLELLAAKQKADDALFDFLISRINQLESQSSFEVHRQALKALGAGGHTAPSPLIVRGFPLPAQVQESPSPFFVPMCKGSQGNDL